MRSQTETDSGDPAGTGYGAGPCYPELATVVLVAAVHVTIELALSEAMAFLFSAVAAAGFLGYLTWRARNSPGVLRTWGMRRDNFREAIRSQLPFGLAAGAALFAFGWFTGSLVLPWGFWLTVGLYPIWGAAQQFALQNLLGRNLAGLVRHPAALALVAAVLFAASHVPRWDLVVLTVVSGFFFTLMYRRVPNLWAVGIVHGVLGSLAVYLVVGDDPGAFLAGALADLLR